MKYYKIIQDKNCVGIANSNSFILYQPEIHSFTAANETTGDLVEYKNKFYRGLWMKPMSADIVIKYTIADIIEITREEYIAFEEAFKENKIIEEETEVEPEYIEPYVEPEKEGVDFIRQSKINEMSYQCRKAIENGIDINLRGETKHFSLTTQDQFNLISLSTMAQTSDIIPYHADGETCIYYTAEEINQIIAAVNSHKIYHTTYYNALKAYINSLETIEEIAAITYGTPIPDEYKTEVLKVISNET